MPLRRVPYVHRRGALGESIQGEVRRPNLLWRPPAALLISSSGDVEPTAPTARRSGTRSATRGRQAKHAIPTRDSPSRATRPRLTVGIYGLHTPSYSSSSCKGDPAFATMPEETPLTKLRVV